MQVCVHALVCKQGFLQHDTPVKEGYKSGGGMFNLLARNCKGCVTWGVVVVVGVCVWGGKMLLVLSAQHVVFKIAIGYSFLK